MPGGGREVQLHPHLLPSTEQMQRPQRSTEKDQKASKPHGDCVTSRQRMLLTHNVDLTDGALSRRPHETRAELELNQHRSWTCLRAQH